jgi:hypothetical protein
MDRGHFANGVILGIGAEVTLHTRRASQAQLQTEGGNAENNPYNTTLKMPGSTDYNFIRPGIAVQNYVSPKQGQEATIKTFKGKGHGYEKIIRLMKANAPASQICIAIIESDWGTGEALDEDGDYLLLEVLSDIKHGRKPNTLAQLEAREVAS